MNEILIYCRTGFEVDTANELTHLATEQGFFGHPVFKSGSGFVRFQFYQDGHAQQFIKQNPVSSTIFPRQMIRIVGELDLDEKSDRISPLLALIEQQSLPRAGLLWVEHPDSDKGRELAKFSRKFAVPLRQKLRQQDMLTRKEFTNGFGIHVFFTDFEHCIVGFSEVKYRSPFTNGICRLKFPAESPSRSTLKLEEAILTMVDADKRDDIFRPGARAVDLGACPGGWTYQLVSREMSVEAVDNGKMAENLMATGLVDYRAEDGFKYKPQFGHVELLVCDMIEQPDRVAKLMADWLCKNWTNHAIFNLKLPMKRRFESVVDAKHLLAEQLNNAGIKTVMTFRHLYHDRDEITVAILRKN